MRKVKFKKWVPIRYGTIEGVVGKNRIKGTGTFSEEFIEDGVFHGWGVSYEEFESGPGNFTIALVESADGTVVEVLPTNLQFQKEKTEPAKPEYVCPHIARLELWIEHKISSEDFKELTHRMDKIREISTDLRHYADHFKNQK